MRCDVRNSVKVRRGVGGDIGEGVDFMVPKIGAPGFPLHIG